MATTKFESSKVRLRDVLEAKETAGGTKAGRKILGALREFSEALAEGKPLEERFTVHRYQLDLTPAEYGPADVRRVRDAMGMSQGLFATFLGVSHATVKSWELGTNTPAPIARRFMDEIAADPARWMAGLASRGSLKAKDAPEGAARGRAAACDAAAPPIPTTIDGGKPVARKPKK